MTPTEDRLLSKLPPTLVRQWTTVRTRRIALPNLLFAHKWADTTAETRLRDLTKFVRCLRTAGMPVDLPLEQLVTKQTIEVFVSQQERKVQPITLAGKLMSLHAVIRCCSHQNWDWLINAACNVRSRAPRTDKTSRLRSTHKIRKAALTLARMARNLRRRQPIRAAVMFRDATMIVVEVSLALRLQELAGMKVSRTGPVIHTSAQSSKTGRSMLKRLGAADRAILDKWISIWRPKLAAKCADGSVSDALWLSRYGREVSPGSIGHIVRKRTIALMGVAQSCNLLRRAAVVGVPDSQVSTVLGHSARSETANSVYRPRDRNAANQKALLFKRRRLCRGR